MKRFLISLGIFVAVWQFCFGALPVRAQGQQVNTGSEIINQFYAAKDSAGYAQPQDPRTIIAQYIRVLLSLLGMIFFLLTLYAGYLWMTAGGNEEQVAQAKAYLSNGVIGLIVILASWSISLFVVRIIYPASLPPNRNVQRTPLYEITPTVNYQ